MSRIHFADVFACAYHDHPLDRLRRCIGLYQLDGAGGGVFCLLGRRTFVWTASISRAAVPSLATAVSLCMRAPDLIERLPGATGSHVHVLTSIRLCPTPQCGASPTLRPRHLRCHPRPSSMFPGTPPAKTAAGHRTCTSAASLPLDTLPRRMQTTVRLKHHRRWCMRAHLAPVRKCGRDFAPRPRSPSSQSPPHECDCDVRPLSQHPPALATGPFRIILSHCVGVRGRCRMGA